MKRFDAETFNKQPAKAYRAADLGEDVYITHSHYPDKVFILSSVKSLSEAIREIGQLEPVELRYIYLTEDRLLQLKSELPTMHICFGMTLFGTDIIDDKDKDDE